MTTKQNTLADWLAQEDEQYQEYVKQREQRRIQWQSALDDANVRTERAERDNERLREKLMQIANHARRAPLGGDDRGSLHAIYGHARAALTAAADKENPND